MGHTLDKGAVIGHDIVAIGASAGGVEALRTLVRNLPADLPAAVFVVVHFPEGVPSMLPHILDRAGPLRAVHPEDGTPIKTGHIYVAPPNLHLLVKNGTIRLARGPKENRHRPAIDPLFRTAAFAYGPRVVGVILSGADRDGSAGLWAIKQCGGVAVVQDPDEALFPKMPEGTLQYVDVDYCLPLDEIAPLLACVVREAVEEKGAYPVPDDMEFESKIAGLDPTVIDSGEHPGKLSMFTCPECAGPLYEIREGKLVRFRCRVGHAYNADDLLDEKSVALENALYVALNTLEESATMSDGMALRAREHGQAHAAVRFEKRAEDARQNAAVIRRILTEEASDTA